MATDSHYFTQRPDVGQGTCAGLYLHLPYCETKCGYCDFYSVPLGDLSAQPALDRILLELKRRRALHDFRIATVFIGGGTPTVLTAGQLATLLSAVREAAGNSIVEECTIEANPATVDAAKARALADGGVTRVSLGAQSFHASELAFLERLHCADDIAPAIEFIRGVGIADYNLDLIFGIGGQSLATWRESLRRAVELGPTHLACYGLTYEPGTAMTKRLVRGELLPCDESLEAEMYLAAIDDLEAAGFEQYEISNFARPGHRCRHNLIYWHNEPYFGIGPSAAGYVDGRRYKNVPNIAEYLRRVAAGASTEIESERVTGVSLAIETVMMQLRLIEGLDVGEVERRTGIALAVRCGPTIAMLRREGLMADDANRLRLTRRGLLVADAIIAELAAAVDTSRSVALPVVGTK